MLTRHTELRDKPLTERILAFRQQETGANLALFAVALMVLLGFAGVAIDGSNIYFQNQRMQIAADAAALGGARQLAIGAAHDAVDGEIETLAFANDADTVTWDYINENRGVHVVAARTFEAYFARLYGYNTFTVNADAEAQYEPVTGVDGLFPLTLDCDCVDDDQIETPGGGGGGGSATPTPTPTAEVEDGDGRGNLLPMTIPCMEFTYGDVYEIWSKTGAAGAGAVGKVAPGAFGWLDWNGGSRGNPELAAAIENPQNSGYWEIGDWVYSGPGVQNSSNVKSALDTQIGKLVTIPLYDMVEGNGANTQYRICGFASFILLGYHFQGNNKYVTASFVSTEGTITFPESASSYGIAYLGRAGNTWTYEVSEIAGADLSYWLLNINTCLAKVVSSTPSGAAIGLDGATGMQGIKWNVDSGFTTGAFSFTLDDDYPAGLVTALAKSATSYGTVSIRGPVCDGTNVGSGDTPAGGTGTAHICLPGLAFETDAAGAALVAGQIIDTEWTAWGVNVTSSNQTGNPAMIFNSAGPTGGDTDLGTPNQDFSGPGVGNGGRDFTPGRNPTALGKVLIVAETNNSSNPDDKATGGSLIFTFAYPVRLDEVQILDIDDTAAAGTVKAYSDAAGATLIATGKMLGLGDNSLQTVAVEGRGVRRLEVTLPQGGALASVTSCRSAVQPTYQLGNLIWSDLNSDGRQVAGEPGVAGVELELYVTGQSYVVARATTNAGGEYTFTGLPAGSYEIKIASSNFAAGKPLAGAVYSPANSGSDDALDSDFVSSTGKAPGILATGNNLTVDGGFILPPTTAPAPDTGVINVNDNKSTKYGISLVGVSGTTWTYRVKELGGRDLSQWNLGVVNCLDKITSYSPSSGYASGLDSSTGFVGSKWVVPTSFADGTFSITLNGNYARGAVQVLAKSSKNDQAQTSIAGPNCSQPVTAPTPTPVPTTDPGIGGGSGSSGETCAFSWLDWNGSTGGTGYMELQGDMNDTTRSGVWHMYQSIPAGPDVAANLLINDALAARVGDTVRIPLTYRGDSGYEVCGFASVQLVDYSLEEGNIWVNLQFLRTLINGVETDPTATDFGARDVRFQQ